MKHYWDGRENDGVHIHYRCVICKVQILHNYERDWSRDLTKMELKVHYIYIFEKLKCSKVIKASSPFGSEPFFRVVTLVLIVRHNFIFL